MERWKGKLLGDHLSEVCFINIDPVFSEVLVKSYLFSNHRLPLGYILNILLPGDIKNDFIRLYGVSCPDYLHAFGNRLFFEFLQQLRHPFQNVGSDRSRI